MHGGADGRAPSLQKLDAGLMQGWRGWVFCAREESPSMGVGDSLLPGSL